MRNHRGFTFVEMLMAMTIFAIVLAGALSLVNTQMRGFNKGSEQMAILQNLSYGADNLESQLRTTGANTLDAQPPVVYASANAFAFNADYVSNDANDLSAVYIDRDAPAAQTEAMRAASQINIPGSSPSFLYPSTDYLNADSVNSPAETITLFFSLDTETSRVDDYVLMRQVNSQLPEVLIRNVLPDSTNLPFFRYYKLRSTGSGTAPFLFLMPASELPVRHNLTIHDNIADTASRIDSLRVVMVSYMVTNGETGTKERKERISLRIPLPNMGVRQVKVCGSEPLLNQPLATFSDLASNAPRVRLTWSPAYDETSGEKDVIRYVLWRRKLTEAWGDPLTSIPSGQASYLYYDQDNLEPTTQYQYRLAAQDCSPQLSSPVLANTTTATPLP